MKCGRERDKFDDDLVEPSKDAMGVSTSVISDMLYCTEGGRSVYKLKQDVDAVLQWAEILGGN